VASTIKIKRSGVSGKQPNTASLSVGELAINYKDQKLYSSNGTSVFEIGGGSGSLTALTTKTLDSLVGTDTVVTGAQTVAASNYLQVANSKSQLANTNAYIATRASWTGLTGTNTAIRTLISDRLQIANASTLYATKSNPSTSGLLAHTGRVTISTNLTVSGNTSLTGIKANNSLGTSGQVLKTNGTSAYWDAAGGAGAVGGGSDKVFYENDITVTTNYTIGTNKNAMTAGPITINSGVVVTVPSGSVWTIV